MSHALRAYDFNSFLRFSHPWQSTTNDNQGELSFRRSKATEPACRQAGNLISASNRTLFFHCLDARLKNLLLQ